MKLQMNKERYLLLIIFIATSIIVLLRAALFKDGWITEDSSAYLSLAQNLVNGNGYYMDNFPDIYQPAITWPVLYSSLIALVSWITTTGVFWSSKIVNLLCFGIVLLVLSKKYSKLTYLFALLFLTAGYLRILSYSWSENVFILGMTVFAIGCGNLLETYNRKGLLVLFTGAMILIYSRWIGAFSILLIGMLSLYYLFYLKERRKFMEIFSIGLLCAAILIAQLYYNYLSVGFATGTERIPNQLGTIATISMILEGYYNEFNLVARGGGYMSLAIFVALLIFTILYFRVYISKTKKVILPFTNYMLEYAFLITGVFYIAVITVMRVVYEFDPLNYRLLGPGSILIFFSLLGFLIKSQAVPVKKIGAYLGLICIGSLFIEGTYYVALSDRTEETYAEAIQDLTEYYSAVPENAYVLWSDMRIRYVRTDIKLVDPSKYNSWEEMIADFPADQPLFIDTALMGHETAVVSLNQFGSDKIFRDEVLEKLPKDQLVRLN